MKPLLTVTGLCALLMAASGPAVAQQPVEERVATLKASLVASQAVLKQYEWVETTVVSLKGEEKRPCQEGQGTTNSKHYAK